MHLIIDYKVVSARSVAELVIFVAEEIQVYGWQPFGSVVYVEGESAYVQPMVIYGERMI